MSGTVINLRRARKLVERNRRAQTAAENRQKHGRTLGERNVEEKEAKRLARTIDGARLSPED
jgi:hypothetical protein